MITLPHRHHTTATAFFERWSARSNSHSEGCDYLYENSHTSGSGQSETWHGYYGHSGCSVDRESSSHAYEKGGQSKGGSFFWTKIDGRSDFEEDRLSFSNWGCESISTWHGPNGPVTSGGFFYSWESAVRHHQHSRTWEGPPLSYENESFCRFDKNTSGNHHCGAGMCQWSCCVNYSPPNPAQGVGANLSLPVDWLPGSYMPGGPFANNGTNSPGFSEQKSQNALDTAIQPANAIAVTMATTENMATTTQSDATPLPLHDEPGSARNPALIQTPRITVEWAANDARFDENPHGPGYRVFPEQPDANTAAQRKVNLVFSVDTYLDKPMPVYFKSLDPANYNRVLMPSDTTQIFGDDNHIRLDLNSEVYVYLPACSEHPDGRKVPLFSDIHRIVLPAGMGPDSPFTVVVEIERGFAGDNFIVVADTNEQRVIDAELGTTTVNLECYKVQPIDGVTSPHTDLLTVWRTLWVECDRLQYYAESRPTPINPNWKPNNPYATLGVPNPADYLGGFVASELARACVEVRVYEPNENQPNIGFNVMTAAEINTMMGVGRDSPVASIDFWTVRVIMATAQDTLQPNALYGRYYPSQNTAVIFYETIRSLYPNASQSTIHTAIQRVLLHEIGHALIDCHHPSSGIMAAYLNPSQMLQSQYLVFRHVDIARLQMYSRVWAE